jgi:hypothetical protein
VAWRIAGPCDSSGPKPGAGAWVFRLTLHPVAVGPAGAGLVDPALVRRASSAAEGGASVSGDCTAFVSEPTNREGDRDRETTGMALRLRRCIGHPHPLIGRG